jgi:hypothetical protein
VAVAATTAAAVGAVVEGVVVVVVAVIVVIGVVVASAIVTAVASIDTIDAAPVAVAVAVITVVGVVVVVVVAVGNFDACGCGVAEGVVIVIVAVGGVDAAARAQHLLKAILQALLRHARELLFDELLGWEAILLRVLLKAVPLGLTRGAARLLPAHRRRRNWKDLLVVGVARRGICPPGRHGARRRTWAHGVCFVTQCGDGSYELQTPSTKMYM